MMAACKPAFLVLAGLAAALCLLLVLRAHLLSDGRSRAEQSASCLEECGFVELGSYSRAPERISLSRMPTPMELIGRRTQMVTLYGNHAARLEHVPR
jgi:hypothetical protein